MKIGGIGDLHINVWNKDNLKYKHISETFNEFYKFCEDNQLSDVIIFGDLFDTKSMTSTIGLLNIISEIDKLAELCYVYIIVGNHDIASSQDTSLSLPNIFQNKKNIKVINDYQRIEKDNIILHFLPYIKDDLLVPALKEINKKLDKKKKNYLFSHFGVQDFTMNKYEEDKNIQSFIDKKSSCIPGNLKGFNHVYLGHYHTYQTQDNITYVGSPMELKHGEEFGSHGFILMDLEDNEHEFIINEFSPKHITLELNKKNLKLISDIKKQGNYYVRLIVNNKVNKEAIFKLKNDLLLKNFDVQIIEKDNQTHQMTVVEGWEEFIKQDTEDIILEFAEKNKTIFLEKDWDIEQMKLLIMEK